MSHVPTGYSKSRGDDGLTDREREVLRRLARGHTDVQIGQALGLSKQRINQVVRVLERLGLVTRAQGRTYISPQGIKIVEGG